MNKIIIFKNLDKTCGIIYPAPALFNKNSKDRINLRRIGIDFKNDNEVLAWIANKDVPAGLEWRIADNSVLPKDRFFRDAWTDSNPTNTIDIDLNKAKEIKINQFRSLREPILRQLDIEYIKANEAKNNIKKNQITQKKQELRDITLLPLPDDLEDLKNFIPEILQNGNNLDR
jgi:hypothetical protein